MRQPVHMTDDLLVKYLLGEASAMERELVEDWKASNETNTKHFDHFKLIWDRSKGIAATSTVDENAAWARFQQRIAKEEKPTATVIPMPKPSMSWMRIAAMLVLMIGGGWLVYFYGMGKSTMALASNDKVVTQTLPDGTVVTLNKNSSISYPKTFKGDTREVTLTGEAFFDVTPDKSHPFIITADDASIKVVGTSFNVKCNASKTEVIVETGIVEVSKGQAGVRLNPKQKAIVLKTRNEPYMENVSDELYNYYRTREFICNGTPLYKLVDVLNEVYGAKIVIANNGIKNLPLTTTFHNESLDNILKVIGDTFNITVERQGDSIILK